jgi:hydroxypyruvate isomerase
MLESPPPNRREFLLKLMFRMKVAANLGFLFTELPPLARIGAAREAGFDGVELLFPYDLDARAVARELRTHGMPLVQINSPPGKREAGEVGFAAVPGCAQEFRDSMETALRWLSDAGGSQLHVVAGVLPAAADVGRVHETYVRNLQWAADIARDVRIMIEPINTRDIPGYALTTVAQAADVLRDVARPNVGLQLDLYHCQIMGGDLTHRIRQFASLIRHVQIAGAPDRNEPDRGEVNVLHVLRTLADVDYDGWISGEYRPTTSTLDSLGWLRILAPFRAPSGG